MATTPSELNDSKPKGNPKGPRVDRRLVKEGDLDRAAERFRAQLFDVSLFSDGPYGAFTPSDVDNYFDAAAAKRVGDAETVKHLAWTHKGEVPSFRKRDSDDFVQQVRRRVKASVGHQHLEDVTIEELWQAAPNHRDLMVEGGEHVHITEVPAQVLMGVAEGVINAEALVDYGLVEEFLSGYTLGQVFYNKDVVLERCEEFLAAKKAEGFFNKAHVEVLINVFGRIFWGESSTLLKNLE